MTQLSIDEGKLFYKLHSALMFFANERLELVRDELADPLPQVGRETRSQASITVVAWQADNVGLRYRSHNWLGEFP